LRDPVVGVEAKKLHADALAMLSKIIDGKLLQANATIGFYPVKRDGETARIFTDESCTDELKRFHFLRQQGKKSSGVPNISLVDFLAPASTKSHDYIGGFAVTTGIGIEKLVVQHEKNHDDYSIIMVKALADRLAEAFAELMHARVRREFWGYAADESLDNELLIKEQYQGIRPAPGYPACPDHTEKQTLFDLLEVEKNTGIILTESYAMYPASSVSGMYFSHPESRYFGLGKIEKDQVRDYAMRKNMNLDIIEKWLAPNLNYEV
jgi:5-methyltetrahydrofolate--homocysteine methyltransferase